jgi:hypothetical protein
LIGAAKSCQNNFSPRARFSAILLFSSATEVADAEFFLNPGEGFFASGPHLQ